MYVHIYLYIYASHFKIDQKIILKKHMLHVWYMFLDLDDIWGECR